MERAERITAGERFERKRALMTPRQPSSRLFVGIRSVDLHEEIQRNGRGSEAATITNDKHSRVSVTTAVFAHLIRAIIIIRGIAVPRCVHRPRKTNRRKPASVVRWALRAWPWANGWDETIDTHDYFRRDYFHAWLSLERLKNSNCDFYSNRGLFCAALLFFNAAVVDNYRYERWVILFKSVFHWYLICFVWS